MHERVTPKWLLSPKWGVGTDPRNWILYRKVGKGWKAAGFYPSAESLLKSWYRKLTRTEPADPDLVRHVSRISRRVEDAAARLFKQINTGWQLRVNQGLPLGSHQMHPSQLSDLLLEHFPAVAPLAPSLIHGYSDLMLKLAAQSGKRHRSAGTDGIPNDAMTIYCRRLQRKFGVDGFRVINEIVGCINHTRNWSVDTNETKAYWLTDKGKQMIEMTRQDRQCAEGDPFVRLEWQRRARTDSANLSGIPVWSIVWHR